MEIGFIIIIVVVLVYLVPFPIKMEPAMKHYLKSRSFPANDAETCESLMKLTPTFTEFFELVPNS